MSVAGNIITAVVALFGVLIGGWLTVFNQERAWRREHGRQWRDIRLEAYKDFLAASRQYIAYALEPNAKIAAVKHPREPGTLMPFFDESGRSYKENLESAFAAARLVSDRPETVAMCYKVINTARQIAAARASVSETELPSSLFEAMWSVEQEFLTCARRELGIPEIQPGSQ